METPFKITKDVTIQAESGELKLKGGKGLTSFYFKDQEKFVFRTPEIRNFANMLLAVADAIEKE